MTPNRNEVLRMAREAGVSTNTRSIWPPTFKHSFDFTEEQLERFAALVADHAAAAEREACAEVATQYAGQCIENASDEDDADYKARFMVYAKHVNRVADAIRARSAKP